MAVIALDKDGNILLEIHSLRVYLESSSSSREFHLLIDNPQIYVEAKSLIGEVGSFYLSVPSLEIDIESKVSVWLKLYLASVTYTYFERKAKLIIGFLDWALILCSQYLVIRFQDSGWTRHR